MSFFAQVPQSPGARLAEQLGGSIGLGIGQQIAQQRQQKQQSMLANLLFGEQGQQFSGLPAEQQLEAAKIQAMAQKQQIKQEQEQEKASKEQQESQLLSKYLRGEQLTPEEQAGLSPTSQRTLIGLQKPTFEPEEEKLEAQRVSQLATEIENEYQAYQAENQRLQRMEKLSEKGELSTPTMVKSLQSIGLPIGILSNPDTEEYAKLETDFLRDLSKVFPGGRITNYEVQAYLKTIPSLMNSSEGKKAIIRNRQLQNEAKKLRYDAYNDIVNENQGKKPRNLGLMINKKINHRLAAIENEFREGIQEQVQKYQQPIRMIDPKGRSVDIPPNRIQEALESGARFQ